MKWIVATIFIVGSVTALAARVIVTRNPTGSTLRQGMLAAASFPIVSFLAAAVIIALQFAQKTPETHNGSFGMVIFTIVMFWFYGLIASAVIGVPSAWYFVRLFQRG